MKNKVKMRLTTEVEFDNVMFDSTIAIKEKSKWSGKARVTEIISNGKTIARRVIGPRIKMFYVAL